MARIRTVKPEFWSHPITGRLEDCCQCLAIALLNLSDDHGYFYAEPASVRSFARPFDDDSTKVRECLENLAEVGYIEVRKHPIRGPIGFVVGFDEHQRVDRPKDSHIKTYFDSCESTINRRKLDDESSLEGRGKERKGREGTEPVPNGPTIIFQIATSHPKATHYRNESELPYALVSSIIKAIDVDTTEKVLEWTQGYALSDSAKYASKDVTRFFNEFQYRPEAWSRGNTRSKFDQIFSGTDEATPGELEQFDGGPAIGPREVSRVPKTV